MHFTIGQILGLLRIYGYYILFPIEVVEGPIVTVLAGFLTSLGIFNFLITYLVVVAGDLTGDVIYYWVGKLWLKALVKNKFGKLKDAYAKYKGKILFFGKLASVIGPTVMIVAGAVGIPFGEFMYINFSGSLFKSLTLILVGYYLGGAVVSLGKNLDWVTTAGLLVLTIIFVGLYVLIAKLSARYLKELEKN